MDGAVRPLREQTGESPAFTAQSGFYSVSLRQPASLTMGRARAGGRIEQKVATEMCTLRGYRRCPIGAANSASGMEKASTSTAASGRS